MAEVQFYSQSADEDNTRYLPSHCSLFIPFQTLHLHDNRLSSVHPAPTSAPFASLAWDQGRSIIKRAGNSFMPTFAKMGNGLLYRWEVSREVDLVVLIQIG